MASMRSDALCKGMAQILFAMPVRGADPAFVWNLKSAI